MRLLLSVLTVLVMAFTSQGLWAGTLQISVGSPSPPSSSGSSPSGPTGPPSGGPGYSHWGPPSSQPGSYQRGDYYSSLPTLGIQDRGRVFMKTPQSETQADVYATMTRRRYGDMASESNGLMERLRAQGSPIPAGIPVSYLPDDMQNRYFPQSFGERASVRYGFSAGLNSGGFSGYVSFGYPGRDSRRRGNDWRYVNLREFYGTDYIYGSYARRIFYDRLDSKHFPEALNELASGVFGALMVWPDQPMLVAHSYALEKLFIHMDKRLRARLVYADGVPYAGRLALAKELVREVLAPLVDSIAIEGRQYYVRFKIASGGRSPWVVVPVIFLEGTFQPNQENVPTLASSYYVLDEPLIFQRPADDGDSSNSFQKAFFVRASTAWKK